MKNLSFADILGMVVCWAGAGTVAYFIRDGLVTIICVAAAYYLSKWIIMKSVEGPTSQKIYMCDDLALFCCPMFMTSYPHKHKDKPIILNIPLPIGAPNRAESVCLLSNGLSDKIDGSYKQCYHIVRVKFVEKRRENNA